MITTNIRIALTIGALALIAIQHTELKLAKSQIEKEHLWAVGEIQKDNARQLVAVNRQWESTLQQQFTREKEANEKLKIYFNKSNQLVADAADARNDLERLRVADASLSATSGTGDPGSCADTTDRFDRLRSVRVEGAQMVEECSRRIPELAAIIQLAK